MRNCIFARFQFHIFKSNRIITICNAYNQLVRIGLPTLYSLHSCYRPRLPSSSTLHTPVKWNDYPTMFFFTPKYDQIDLFLWGILMTKFLGMPRNSHSLAVVGSLATSIINNFSGAFIKYFLISLFRRSYISI